MEFIQGHVPKHPDQNLFTKVPFANWASSTHSANRWASEVVIMNCIAIIIMLLSLNLYHFDIHIASIENNIYRLELSTKLDTLANVYLYDYKTVCTSKKN